MSCKLRVLAPIAVLAGLWVFAAPAWGTNFVGKITVTGDATSASTVSSGQQCADDVNGPGSACT